MKTLFLEKSLGLDIREDSIALTLLGKKLRLVEVLAGEFIELKLLTGKDEKAEKHFLNKVNRFLIEQDSWPESVVVSLPRSLITFKTFELPAPDMEIVRSMVEFELERHFSSGLDELYYTFQLTQKPGNIYHVASAAIKKEIANYYLELIQKLNLKTTVLDISTFANTNLALSLESKEFNVSALVDISPHALDIVIVKNGIIEFSRSRTWENLDIRDAYSGKINSPGQLESLSQSISKIIIDELEQALSSCRNIEDNESIGQIFIVGGGALASQVAPYLEKETEVPTKLLGVPDSVVSVLPESFSASYMLTALSLALRDFKNQKIKTNLLPKELQPRRRKVNPKTTLALAATVVLLLAGWVASQIAYNNKTLASLNVQLQEIKGQVTGLEKIDLEYMSAKQYVDVLNTISSQYPSKLPILSELSRSLPKDTWVTNLKIQQRDMEIKGFSPAASKLIPLLENSPSFKETGFVGTIISGSAGEKFTIRANLETSS